MGLRKLDLMHHVYGVSEGHKCGECCNLFAGRWHDKTIRKCRVYGLTHSEASDWAKRWQACGAFNRSDLQGIDIIRLVKKADVLKDEEKPIEGQICLSALKGEQHERNSV